MGEATAVGNCDDACTGSTPQIVHPAIIPANTAAMPETIKRSIVTSANVGYAHHSGGVVVGGYPWNTPVASTINGRWALKEIKLMKDNAAAVEQQADDIKARYTRCFKV